MKVRVIADMLEEQWPSMDLFAEMLVQYLPQTSPPVDIELFRLPLKRRFSRVAGARSLILDRLMGRHFDYRRELRRRATNADIDHVVDQTYAAATVGSARAGRTVVTCHDLDALNPLEAPPRSIRDHLLSTLAKRTADGLRSVAHVVCVSEVVKNELVSHCWVQAHKISVIPGGVHPSLSEHANAVGDAAVEKLIGAPQGPEILHIGSTIRRKGIGTLLEAFAGVRKERPDVRLLRAGGAFTEGQRRTASRLGLTEAIVTLPFLTRLELAALYRRATIVVLPSESEGFGLPLIEAMACGTPVLASSLDVFREVAGEAAAYASVREPIEWIRGILTLLDERQTSPDLWRERIARGLAHASRYSWQEHTHRLFELYSRMLNE